MLLCKELYEDFLVERLESLLSCFASNKVNYSFVLKIGKRETYKLITVKQARQVKSLQRKEEMK